MAQQPITLGDLEKNPERLHQFIAENTRPMIQFCVRKFENINEEDAEDLVQDAFLKLVEIVQGKVQSPDAPARAWMYQELKWRCIDFVREKERKEKVIANRNEENIEDGENIIDSLPDPTSIEDEIIRMDDEIRLRKIYPVLRACIQELKGRRREIFGLYLEGYIAAEIAQKLGVTRAFVAKETKIGFRNLRQCLTRHGFSGDSIRGLLSTA
ncbi:sigma-70 family RNA polymerase sigma factor [Candidatus Poribacteria bacterium]|nr:sigma-70 family RNA polymerase sigma factor [Candidatus Poribacteria bacterium]